jgi:hypothetical protein
VCTVVAAKKQVDMERAKLDFIEHRSPCHGTNLIPAITIPASAKVLAQQFHHATHDECGQTLYT